MKKTLITAVSVLAATTAFADHTSSASIAIYYYDTDTDAKALEFRQLAREAGHKVRKADVIQVSSEGYVVSKTEVRYFFDRTKPLAEIVARDLGLGPEALLPLDAEEFGVEDWYDHSVEVWIVPSK